MVELKVTKILDRLEQKLKITRCGRIGQGKSRTVRPIKLRVQSSSTVYQILRSAKLMKEIEDLKKIYLCPDGIIEERTNRRKPVEELKQQGLADSNKKYCILKGEITIV